MTHYVTLLPHFANTPAAAGYHLQKNNATQSSTCGFAISVLSVTWSIPCPRVTVSCK